MPQPKHGGGGYGGGGGGGGKFRKDKFRKGKFQHKGNFGGGGGGGGKRVECPMCGQTVPNLAQHIREKHDYPPE